MGSNRFFREFLLRPHEKSRFDPFFGFFENTEERPTTVTAGQLIEIESGHMLL